MADSRSWGFGSQEGDYGEFAGGVGGGGNPLNIGAVARAMSNFGAMHLRVVAPYEKAWREAKWRWARRS